LPPRFKFYDLLWRRNQNTFLKFLNFNVSVNNGVTVGTLEGSLINEVVSCGYTPCMDDIDDSSLFQLVWSWQQPYTTISCEKGNCPVAAPGGWKQVSCTESYKAACQSQFDPTDWELSSSTPFSNVQCQTGYTFSYPRTPQENSALYSVTLNETMVWLNIPLSYQPDNPICSYVPQNVSQASHSSLYFNSFLVFFFSLFVLFYAI